MRFSYTALKNNGARITGSAEAKDKFDLARTLKAEGGMLVSAKEEGSGVPFAIILKINAFLSRVSMQERIIFARNLSAMIRAGLALSRGISIMERQTPNEKFKGILRALGSDIASGGTLSTAAAKFPAVFSSLFVSMVRSGEESGGLADALAVVAGQMEKSWELHKKIRGAMIYPAIIVIAMIIIGIIMLIFVVPTLTNTFKELNVELPKSTQAIILVSDFLSAHTILSLFIIAILALGGFLFFRSKTGQRTSDFLLLHMPLINGLAKKTNAARTARTLSSLLSSGVDIIEALAITKDVVQNSYYKEVLKNAQERVGKGTTLSLVFKEANMLYPVLMSEMIEVGEETGKLSDMLGQIASFYEGEVEGATKNLSTIIEPLLMVVVGTVVGFFAVAMISPTYSLLNSI